MEARFATVSGSVPEESSDQRHGSQLRTRQLLAFPLCKHNTVLQQKKHTHTLTHTLSHTHTHTLSHTHTHSHTLSHTHSLPPLPEHGCSNLNNSTLKAGHPAVFSHNQLTNINRKHNFTFGTAKRFDPKGSSTG